MRIETNVPGNYVDVDRDSFRPAFVCVRAACYGSHTCNSLSKNKAVAYAKEILRLVTTVTEEDLAPMGADW